MRRRCRSARCARTTSRRRQQTRRTRRCARPAPATAGTCRAPRTTARERPRAPPRPPAAHRPGGATSRRPRRRGGGRRARDASAGRCGSSRCWRSRPGCRARASAAAAARARRWQTAEGAPIGLIRPSSDPKALRRYSRRRVRAGARLRRDRRRSTAPRCRPSRQSATATGRSTASGSTTSSPRLRGALLRPGPREASADGARLLVSDRRLRASPWSRQPPAGARRRRPAGPPRRCCGRRSPRPATRRSRSSRSPARQQWAIEVVLERRACALRPGASLCTRGADRPAHAVPADGAYG